MTTSEHEESLAILKTSSNSDDNTTLLQSSDLESHMISDTSLMAKRGTTVGMMKQSSSPSVTLKSQLRSRPKSFAQKFRPNSRLAGMSGYSNLGESPIQEQKDSFILTSAPLERISEEKTTEKCWKTMYNLLELYSTMPTTKTVHRQSIAPHSVNSGSGLDTGILLKPGRRTTTANTPISGNASLHSKDIEMGDLSKLDSSLSLIHI